ncbi:hypothetical protein UK12_35145, partial [Saccharothrix sp. ST-888]
AYTSEDDPREPAEIATALAEIVRGECRAAELQAPRLRVDPGRPIVGPTAFTLSEVGRAKRSEGRSTMLGGASTQRTASAAAPPVSEGTNFWSSCAVAMNSWV